MQDFRLTKNVKAINFEAVSASKDRDTEKIGTVVPK